MEEGATDRKRTKIKRSVAPSPPDLTDELGPLAEAPLDLRGVQILERHLVGVDLSDRNGEGVQLVECRAENVDLAGATLRRSSIRDVVVDGGSWANVDFTEAALQRVELRNVRLTGAVLAGASLRDMSFVDCRMDLSAIRFGRLERVRFENCRMEEIDLYEARLSSVVFAGCGLTNASLAKAAFSSCEMHECDLAGIGNPEQLRGVGMPWPDIVRSAAVLAAAAGVRVIDTQ
jgi:uncharacterized protein YjbI with pentapeptide repeats